MKTYDFTTSDNKAKFYITNDGDIMDSLDDIAPAEYAVAEVIVDGFYVGSLDEMRKHALRLYKNAID